MRVNKYKKLLFRDIVDSKKGKLISYIQDNDLNPDIFLEAPNYPFVISPEDPNFRRIAIQCANQCQAWADSIREYAGLPLKETKNFNNMNQDTSKTDLVVPRREIDEHEYEENEENEDDKYEKSIEDFGL